MLSKQTHQLRFAAKSDNKTVNNQVDVAKKRFCVNKVYHANPKIFNAMKFKSEKFEIIVSVNYPEFEFT